MDQSDAAPGAGAAAARSANRKGVASTPYWSLWLACLLGYAAIGMTIQVMPDFAQALGAGSVASGVAVTIGALATMVARPVAGHLADRHGARGVVLAGAALGLAGGVCHAVAAGLPMLILARLVLGAGEGALFTASIGWVLSDASPDQRGKVAGHFGLSMWLGLAGGPIAGAALVAITGYRGVWLAASAMPLLACLLLAATGRQRQASRVPAHGVPAGRRAWVPRAAWRPGASNVCAGIGYGVIAAFLVPRFADSHWPGRNLALAVFGIAFISTRFVGSPVVDRLGARRVMLVVFLTEMIGPAGLATSSTAGSAFVFVALTGAGLSLLYPCLAAWVSDGAEAHQRTAALGCVTSAWDLGVALGGPLGGSVAGVWAGAPFALGAFAALIATLPLLSRPR